MSEFPPRPLGKVFQAEIEIDAPAERVWPILADVDGWGRWNPIYPEASGLLAESEEIRLKIALPSSRPQVMQAKVHRLVEGRAIQFGATVLGGLLRAERFIELHRLDENRCLVVNGEVLSRPLGPLLARMGGSTLAKGLRRQNEGLKSAAETAAA